MSGQDNQGWIVSRRTGWRAVWGVLGILVFGAAFVAALVAVVSAPHVDSGMLVIITLPFFAAAIVMAAEGVSQGLVHLDADGYRMPLRPRRAWTDVLGVGLGEVDGRRTPVVAVAGTGDFPVIQDTFPGFADADAEALINAIGARVGEPRGFSGLTVDDAWWGDVEAEADRVAALVADAISRDPLARERVSYGYPGLVSAVRLDYGMNEAGDRVEVLCRRTSDLALTHEGRRWLRQNGKRSADPAGQVAWLLGAYQLTEAPSGGAGFDRVTVQVEGQRPLRFNAEEPDRFAMAA